MLQKTDAIIKEVSKAISQSRPTAVFVREWQAKITKVNDKMGQKPEKWTGELVHTKILQIYILNGVFLAYKES